MRMAELIVLGTLACWVYTCPAAAQIAFDPPVNYPGGVPGYDCSVAAADFDGDGDQDLANVHWVLPPYQSRVQVRWNLGDGTFSAAVDPYGLVGNLRGLAAAELNGDASPDLALAIGGSVRLLFNTGAGAFVFGPSLGAGGVTGVMTVAAGDLDGDGDIDLAAGKWEWEVRIYRNNGDGTFEQTLAYDTYGQAVQSIALGDLDGDTDLDVITANRFGPAEVTVLLNNGDATFVLGTYFPLSSSRPYSVTLADVDGDADLDAAVANSAMPTGIPSVALLRNNGDATFAPPVYYDAGPTPIAVRPGDFDLDGDADLAVANHNAILNTVSILANDGQGTFGSPVSFPAGGYPYSVLIANLNGDLEADLVCAVTAASSNDVSVLSNTTVAVGVDEDGVEVAPRGFRLCEVVPNPFRPPTTIRFALPVQGRVRAEVYSAAGRRVRTLLAHSLPAGDQVLEWNGMSDAGGAVGGGVYFLRLDVTGSNGRRFAGVGKLVILSPR